MRPAKTAYFEYYLLMPRVFLKKAETPAHHIGASDGAFFNETSGLSYHDSPSILTKKIQSWRMPWMLPDAARSSAVPRERPP